MNRLNEILSEIGVSKVKLAKYLGVSRQMVYNYLEMDSISDWPLEKKMKLFNLLNIKSQDEIDSIEVDSDFIKHANNLINDSTYFSTLQEKGRISFNDLNNNDQKLLNDIISLLKEKIDDDEINGRNMLRYLYYFLEVSDNTDTINYILAYVAKTTGFINANEFVFNEDEQFAFESILYSAMVMYQSKSASRTKLIEVHKKFEDEIKEKHEEILSRTQELVSAQEQALKELGYSEITQENSTEVYEKMAEIQSRNI